MPMGIGPGAPIMTCMAGTFPDAAAPASASSQGRADRTAPRPSAISTCSSSVRPAVRMAETSVPMASAEISVSGCAGPSSLLRSSSPGDGGTAGQGSSRAQALSASRTTAAASASPRIARPGGLDQAVEPGEASEGGVQNADRPRRQMPGRLKTSDACGEVGGGAGEQRGAGGLLLARRPGEGEDHGAVAGDLLSAEDVAGGIHGLHQKHRVVVRAERHGDGELSVGERHRLRQVGAGAGVPHAEPHGLSRGPLAVDQHPTADTSHGIAHGGGSRRKEATCWGSATLACAAGAGQCSSRSSDDLSQTVDCSGHLLLRGARQPLSNAVDRQGSNLGDLDPGSLRQALGSALEGQGKTGPWFLTRHRHRDHGSGALVEDVVAQDQHRPASRLFAAANRVEVGPPDFAP